MSQCVQSLLTLQSPFCVCCSTTALLQHLQYQCRVVGADCAYLVHRLLVDRNEITKLQSQLSEARQQLKRNNNTTAAPLQTQVYILDCIPTEGGHCKSGFRGFHSVLVSSFDMALCCREKGIRQRTRSCVNFCKSAATFQLNSMVPQVQSSGYEHNGSDRIHLIRTQVEKEKLAAAAMSREIVKELR